MKRLLCGVTVALLIVGGGSASADQGKSKGKGKASHEKAKDTAADTNVAVHVVFAPTEVTVLRNHYAPRYRDLPPGLQKKLEVFPPDVERRLPVLPQYYRRGILDGNAVIYNSRTNVIVDVAVMF
jgi:hypothetical protein